VGALNGDRRDEREKNHLKPAHVHFLPVVGAVNLDGNRNRNKKNFAYAHSEAMASCSVTLPQPEYEYPLSKIQGKNGARAY
jgi:hypothetical protein